MQNSIEELLRNLSFEMTRAERKVADVISQNYPLSGLGTITMLAERAEVSAPTVARFVQKLGFEKYTEFQEQLRHEVDDRLSDTAISSNPWSPEVPEAHVLNAVTEAVVNNVRQSIDDIDVSAFEGMCNLLSEPSRGIFILGGRVTFSLADNFYQYLQVIRKGVQFINTAHINRFYSLLDMRRGDILFVYDIRRYESSIYELVEKAHDLGVLVILVTDQWGSPVVQFASHILRARIAMPTRRDSMVSLMLLNEVVIAQVHHTLGERATNRIDNLEELLKGQGFFHKA